MQPQQDPPQGGLGSKAYHTPFKIYFKTCVVVGVINGSFLLRYQIEVSDDLISISSDTYVINLVIKSDIQISEGI